MDTKKVLIAAAALLVGLVLGFAIGQPMGQRAARQQAEAELQRLKGIIEEFWPTEPEMFSISGQVIEVKTNSLLIETPSVHPLEDTPTVREILAAEDTIIVKQTEKDPKIYEREMEEYMKLEEKLRAQMEAGIEPEERPESPKYYLETEITLADIEAGNRVFVETDQNIKWAERFTATRIAVEF